MALINNLTDPQKLLLRTIHFGLFDTLAYVNGYSVGEQKDDIKDNPSIDLKAQGVLDKIQAKIGDKPYLIVKPNDIIYYIFIPNFEANRKFEVQVTTGTFSFITAVCEDLDHDSYLLATNGNQTYGKSNLGKVNGHVWKNGVEVLTGSTLAQFSQSGSMQFNASPAKLIFKYEEEPNGGNGFGGLSPVIIDGQKYGEVTNGDIIANNQYNINLKYYTSGVKRTNCGKHVFAYRKPDGSGTFGTDMAIIVINENSGANYGIDIDTIRDILDGFGCENAVGMDGSNSVFLYEYRRQKNKMRINIGPDKYLGSKTAYAIKETNT